MNKLRVWEAWPIRQMPLLEYSAELECKPSYVLLQVFGVLTVALLLS